MSALRASGPLTCRDLAARRLINEAHCCDHCHDWRKGEVGFVALVIFDERRQIDVEVCCTQAKVLGAHTLIPNSGQIEEV